VSIRDKAAGAFFVLLLALIAVIEVIDYPATMAGGGSGL